MFARLAPTAALVLVMAAAAPAAAAEDPVVAVVNDVEIRMSQVTEAHERLPEQYRQVPFETIFSGLVDSLIDSKLAAEDARRQKLHEGQAFKDQMARIEDQVLQRMVLSRAMVAGVTDADVKALYASLTKDFDGNEQIQVRHILLKTEEVAKAVIVELQKGGDFAALAREKSTGPSASDGGDLGFFSKGQMVPEFEAVAFPLKKGEFSEKPVKTQFGWHVIKLEDRKKSKMPPFEKLQESLRNELSQKRGTAYITQLRSSARITRFNADGSPMEGGKPVVKKPPAAK